MFLSALARILRRDRWTVFLMKPDTLLRRQFVTAFDEIFRSEGATIIRTPPYTPVANAYAERWVATVRRELLDRTIVLGAGHLRNQLHDYVEHDNQHRPHRGLGQRAPNRADVVEFRPGHPIRHHTTCGGLINEYRQAA
jgi:putative transposase